MPELATYNREDFIGRKWLYEGGEDIGLLGPSGSGKTVLAHQLAAKSMEQNPKLRYVVFQPKPDDESTLRAADTLNLGIRTEYPFRKKLFQSPSGHVFWPQHRTDSTEADIEHTTKVMKDALNAEYWRGNVLAFTDDAFLLESKYGCAPEVEQYLIAGRSSKAGVMFALQAPKGSVRSGVSSFHFSQPVHLFFARENIQSNRDRYGEVAMGIDPATIDHVVKNLKTYSINGSNVSEMLYLCKRGPVACIVTPF